VRRDNDENIIHLSDGEQPPVHAGTGAPAPSGTPAAPVVSTAPVVPPAPRTPVSKGTTTPSSTDKGCLKASNTVSGVQEAVHTEQERRMMMLREKLAEQSALKLELCKLELEEAARVCEHECLECKRNREQSLAMMHLQLAIFTGRAGGSGGSASLGNGINHAAQTRTTLTSLSLQIWTWTTEACTGRGTWTSLCSM
jgi:hypothetical protein